MATARALPRPAVWLIRGASLAMIVVGIWIGFRKFHTSPEQEELRRYVEHQVPAFVERERPIYEKLETLDNAPGPTPDEAHRLLVDEVIPRLIALRSTATAVVARTDALREVNAGYVGYVDKLIDACRSSVRAIDDPAGDPKEANRNVRRRFYEAGQA